MNLLSNAAKFTREGAITITAKLSRGALNRAQRRSLPKSAWRTQEFGIKEEDLGAIFDKFRAGGSHHRPAARGHRAWAEHRQRVGGIGTKA